MRSLDLRLITLILIVCCSYLAGGNTGKIAGSVVDKRTGDVLIGGNVIVQGTEFGAATDLKGRYFILQVPPGKFEIVCSYIGYHTLTITDVDVHVDLTSTINFELEPLTIKTPVVTINAKKYMVQKDATSTRREILQAELEGSPGLESTADIFRLQGGVYEGGASESIAMEGGTQLQVRDESLKDVHVRGGRGGEILYLVDGMPVNHPIYGGRSVVDLNVVDVRGVELLTGAFNAEYGQAQSGVVNITTRTGSDKLIGGVEYKTDEPAVWGPSYATQYGAFYLGGPEPITGKLLPAIGLKIPGKIYYFISGNAKQTNTQYNNHNIRNTISILGLDIEEKQDNSTNINMKISYNIHDNIRIALRHHASSRTWSNYNWLWQANPDHIAAYSRDNINTNLAFNHTISNSIFYSLNFGYLAVKYNGSQNGRTPADFWEFVDIDDSTRVIQSTIKAPTRDALTGFYDSQGYENPWRNDNTKTYTVKADITSQIHPAHLMKSGLQLQYNTIHYVDIADGGERLSRYGEWHFSNDPGKDSVAVEAPHGPYKEYGELRWVFDAYPIIGGAYIQDKYEMESIIINAGLRCDWFIPGSSVMSSDWKSQWESVTGLKADWPSVRYQVSPRFGISYPISPMTALFFSYGHFSQLPELQYYYRDSYSGEFVGNPHLTYEETILYEFGFTHQLSKNWSIDLKNYTKDISKQVGTNPSQATSVTGASGFAVNLYDNKGYARVRGLEFELKKRSSGISSGTITYTIQWADGYSSSAFDDYKRSQSAMPYPIRERRLSWDIRHQVILRAMLFSPAKHHINLFGLPLPDDWQLAILAKIASGNPYSPGTYSIIEKQTLENSADGPMTSSIDVKFDKKINIGGIGFAVFVNIFNILDQKNTQIKHGFNRWTGKPFTYGDTVSNTEQYWLWHDMYRMMTPKQFSTGRHVDFGLKVNF